MRGGFIMKKKILVYGMEEQELNKLNPFFEMMGMKAKALKKHLQETTAVFAFGCDTVSISAEDRADKETIDELIEAGVKTITTRSNGFKNIDMEYAKGKLSIIKMPDFSLPLLG